MEQVITLDILEKLPSLDTSIVFLDAMTDLEVLVYNQKMKTIVKYTHKKKKHESCQS